jgi:serine/threonine protein kinase
MRHNCTHCGRSSQDGNLWCEQVNCPAGNVPAILTWGEYLGDIKISRALRVFRTAVIYEATRGGERILLKVSHEGHEEQLKREADILKTFANRAQDGLPRLLPAYRNTGTAQAYGKAVFGGQLKYYEVFAFNEGEFLHDLLLENPQPWYQHVGWIMIGLAQTLTALQKAGHGGMIHGNINPDAILVRYDRDGVPRTTLVDLGLMLQPGQRVDAKQARDIAAHALPAYTPPELIKSGAEATHTADSYGLGLILYEMLAGQPAFTYKLRQNEQIRHTVQTQDPPPIYRRDIPQPDAMTQLIQSSLHKDPAKRPPHVGAMGAKLQEFFGGLPAERRTWRARFSGQAAAFATMLTLGAIIVVLLMLVAALIG